MVRRLAAGAKRIRTLCPARNDLSFGGQMQELPFHGVDLGKICCDVVIAAALLGYEAEAAAREFRRWTCAAEMNDRSQLIPLLTADLPRSAVTLRSRNTAVSSVAWRGTTREYSAVPEQPVSTTIWWRMQ
jgi:hypothetical protein